MGSVNLIIKNVQDNIKPSQKESSITLQRKVDLCIFFVLFCFVLLFQLQVVVEFISKYWVREVLYAYLYLKIIFFYRIRLSYALICVFIFLAYSVFTGFLTFMLFDIDLAFRGFTRFVNVVLLAPLAAVLFTNKKQFVYFIKLWVGIVLIGAFTAFYQLFGGDLYWLIQDYIAARGGLIRFKTLLGEPNIGGMASVFVFIFALLSVKSIIWKSVLLIISTLLLIISISKAALAGLIISVFFILIFNYQLKDLFNIKFIHIRKTVSSFLVIFLFISLIFVVIPEDIDDMIMQYGETALSAFVGTGEGQGTTRGVADDFVGRFMRNPQRQFEIVKIDNDLYPINIIVGSSFGQVGSAVRGILPHNSYLEIFLVGGIIKILIFITLLVFVFKRIKTLYGYDEYYKLFAIWFLLAVIYMTSYPIIYQPILGTLFWMIVGLSCNQEVFKNSL